MATNTLVAFPNFVGGSLIHITVSMAFVHFIYSMVTMATRALMDKIYSMKRFSDTPCDYSMTIYTLHFNAVSAW
jgi:hypothetical protein